jgi:ATP-dependent Clp protease ATP-binding subunit ClpB
MRFDKFTQKSQEAVAAAQELAHEKGHPELKPLHLLHGLLAPDQATIESLLAKLKANPAVLRASVDRELAKLPQTSGGQAGGPP